MWFKLHETSRLTALVVYKLIPKSVPQLRLRSWEQSERIPSKVSGPDLGT